MKKGITLILAVLVSSLALTLGMGVFTLLFSQIEFSGVAKESTVAFYAADSGVECALFWDINHDSFATSSISTINCDEDSFEVGGSSGLSVFTLPLGNGSCANVEVEKSDNFTVITSLGENFCGVVSSKTVQRGLRVSY